MRKETHIHSKTLSRYIRSYRETLYSPILREKLLKYIQSGSHRAVVADVEEVLLPLCSGGHVTPLHAAPDPVRGVPHELRVVPDLVQVVRAPVEPVLQWSQDVFKYSSFIKF